MVYLEAGPKENAYRKLIRFALATCDAFSLTTRGAGRDADYAAKVKKVLDRIEPYLIKIKESSCYPMAKEYFYQCDEKLVEFLLEPQNLYNWNWPNYPQDPCFYRKGFIWLCTVSHEEECTIILRNKEERALLKSYGIRLGKYERDDENGMHYEEGLYDRWRPRDVPVCKVFISHAWREDEEYGKMLGLLTSYAKSYPKEYAWCFTSDPKIPSEIDPMTKAGQKKLRELLEEQMRQAKVMLLLKSMLLDDTQKWVKYEIDLARAYKRSIIDVEPFDKPPTGIAVPSMTTHLGWNESIALTIQHACSF